MTDDETPRRLLVNGRQVARYWGVHHALVGQAERAGLVSKHVVTKPGPAESVPATDEQSPAIVEQGYDADRVLELGARRYIDPAQLAWFTPGSILLVQQTSVRWNSSGDFDHDWRPAYGWHTALEPEDARDSARGWWAIEPRRRAGVVAIVSSVSSFVVTLAVVKEGAEVTRHPDGRVRFEVEAPDEGTPLGRALIRVFHRRRVPVRPGVSRLIPHPGGPPIG